MPTSRSASSGTACPLALALALALGIASLIFGFPIFVDAGLVVMLPAAVLRIVQGSATVALTTAAGLVSPAIAAGGYNGFQLAALVAAVAAGSVVVSHVNDSGFWLVGRCLEMDVKTTLKTWTVMETTIGVMGFGIPAAVFGLASVG